MTGFMSRTRRATRTVLVACAATAAFGGPVAAAQAASHKPAPPLAKTTHSDANQPSGTITGHKTH